MVVSLGWILEANGVVASGVKIDNTPLAIDGAINSPMDGFSANTSWTYVKLVNAGSHTVQPIAAYAGNTTLYGHSVVIRLYQR